MNGTARLARALLPLGTSVLAAASCRSPADAAHPGRAVEPADAADAADAGAPPRGTLLYHHEFLADHLPAVSGLAASPDGDVWIAGAFAGSLQIGDTTLTGAAPTDIFVARLDPAGDPRSSARVGSPEVDAYTGLALDANGDVIVAHGNAPTSLVKLDPTGSVLWRKDVLEPAPVLHDADLMEAVEAMASDGAGGVLLVNGSDGRVQVGSRVLRGLNHVLVEVDANGDVRWSSSVGSGGFWGGDRAMGIAVGGMGRVVVALNDAPEARHVRLNTYDGAGDSLGYRLVHGSGIIHASSLAAGPGDEILLSGTAAAEPGSPPSSLPGAWLMKLDASGNRLWVTPMDAGKVALDGAGNAYDVTGTSVTKLDPTGVVLWRWSARTTGGAGVGAVAVDPTGHLVVAGTFSGTYDFGDGPVDSGPGAALFVMGFDD